MLRPVQPLEVFPISRQSSLPSLPQSLARIIAYRIGESIEIPDYSYMPDSFDFLLVPLGLEFFKA
jgi:hypothetical protein